MNQNKFPSLGVNLWQFQKDFLNDRSRFVAAMWARGNGKSKMTALKIVLDVFEKEASGKPSVWLIVSATAGQAKEALTHVAGWAQAIYKIAIKIEIVETEVEFKTEHGKERYTLYEIRIGSGSKIMALSASPSAIRGYTANLWGDELCFFQNDHEMWAAMQHCTRGYLKIIVTSTPIGGSERKFHQIMHDESIVHGKPLWSKHTCDIYQAIAGGRVYDLESERAAADPYSWKQELELQWMDTPNTWFSSELIAACEDSRASTLGHGYERGRCFIGNDIALRGDKWVATVMEASEDFVYHTEEKPNGQKVGYYTGELVMRELVVLDRSTFEDHDRQIARLMHKYNVIRLCLDQSGMGERSTEEYQNLYGSRCEGVIFNVENKASMAMLGLELMTDRRVLLPQNHPEIGLDFRKLQRIVSAGGAVRFNAQRDSSGHADICWAFLLALNAAVTPTSPIEFDGSDYKDSFYDLQDFAYD